MTAPTKTAKTRTRRTQEERSAETQRKLLDATIECLVELGYTATTTTEIAKRAGVSRGAQMHHFPTKADLVAAAVEHLSSRIGEDLQREAARLPANGDRISAAVDLLWSRFSAPLFPAYFELAAAARTDPDLRRNLVALEKRVRGAIDRRCHEIFGESVAAGPGYETAVDLTILLMQGMALDRSLTPAGARGRRREEKRLLETWKRVMPAILTGLVVPG